MTKKIALHADEKIIAVIPEHCSGPGWSNMPIWVYIIDSSQKLRTECIQPDEMTREMWTLFKAGAAMCEALVSAVPVKLLGTYSNGEPVKKRKSI